MKESAGRIFQSRQSGLVQDEHYRGEVGKGEATGEKEEGNQRSHHNAEDGDAGPAAVPPGNLG